MNKQPLSLFSSTPDSAHKVTEQHPQDRSSPPKAYTNLSVSAPGITPTNLRFLAGLLLIWLLTIPAVTPLLQPNTITDSADGLLHLYRLVTLDHAFDQGAFFPRWLPDLAYGYGLPLFVFYPPLSYYFTLALKLPGFNAVNALNVSFSLALLLSATGAYLFVRDRFGTKAGVLAGVAYVYAPILLLNALYRGSLPAVWAMAIFPFVFWIFGRLIGQSMVNPRRNPLLLSFSALVFGVALLMHNSSNLLFVPFLGLYLGSELLIQVAISRQSRRNEKVHFSTPPVFKQVVLPVGVAGILGVGLAAFFLLPALIEKEFAQVERVIISPDFDFRFHFVTLKELLLWPKPANTGLLNPRYPFVLGLVQVGLAFTGLLGIHRLCQPRQRAAVVFVIIELVGVIFMMLPLSLGVWEQFPWLAFVQHPTRLLAPAAFMLAILAGLAVKAFPKWSSVGVTLVGIILIFVTALPLLYPRYREPFPAVPTLLDMMAYEHASGAIGTTSFGEYLPIWVKQAPLESFLEPMYQTGATIERLDLAYLPPGSKLVSASYGFNQAELIIDSPEPYQAIFHTFFFPGWTARIDGQPGQIAPVSERGLIGVPMPAGQHQLVLYFRETPLRRVANTISMVSLAVILALFVIGLKHFKSGIVPSPNGFTTRQFAILGGLGLVLIVAKVTYFVRFDNPLKHTFDDMSVAGVDVSKQVNFGHQVNLLGYDLDRQTITPGQSFNLIAYWQARQRLDINYSTLAQVVDAEHHLYAAQDNLHPGELPTTRWSPWGFVRDRHAVRVPPGTPPGDYFLVTGLYDPSTWARLPVLEGGDSGWADVIAIPVTVVKPAQPPTIAKLDISWPTEVKFGSELLLLGATPERDAILPNDFLRITLFWQALTTPTVDYQIRSQVVTGDGAVALTQTGQPSHNRYPTTYWTVGERVRDNHAFWIPLDFSAGMYHIQVQVLDEAGQPVGGWVELGKIKVAE